MLGWSRPVGRENSSRHNQEQSTGRSAVPNQLQWIGISVPIFHATVSNKKTSIAYITRLKWNLWDLITLIIWSTIGVAVLWYINLVLKQQYNRHKECRTASNLIEDYNIMKLDEHLHQIIIGLTKAGTMLIWSKRPREICQTVPFLNWLLYTNIGENYCSVDFQLYRI
jgi:hypothetical protein